MSIVSAKIDYACQAVLALAVEYERDQPVPMKGMAEAHKIPAQFLAQIFQQLRSSGMVTSVRGACGGYRLSRSPDSITVWDVVSVFEGCESSKSTQSSENPLTVAIHSTWKKVETSRREILQSTTFADLAQQVAETGVSMYYI